MQQNSSYLVEGLFVFNKLKTVIQAIHKLDMHCGITKEKASILIKALK